MSVLAHDAPARPAQESLPRDRHAIRIAVQSLAIVAIAGYLSLGVTWWFAPLSALLIGVTAWASHRQPSSAIAHPPRPARTALAELPTLIGQR